jgi:hypothetical protein
MRKYVRASLKSLLSCGGKAARCEPAKEPGKA